MNYRNFILLSLGGLAAGFGVAKWSQSSVPVRPATAPPPPIANVPPSSPQPPISIQFPHLDTADECRAFLKSNANLAGVTHPLAKKAVRDFVMRRWLELDAESALMEAERETLPLHHQRGMGADLFRVWLDLNTESALDSFAKASPALQKRLGSSVLAALAERDPERGMKFSETHNLYAGTLVKIWAKSAPEAAVKACNPGFLPTILDVWAKQDPQAALKFALNSGDPKTVDNLLRSTALIMQLFQTDPTRAAEVYSRATDFEKQEIASAMAGQSPAEALAWAKRQSGFDDLAKQVLASVASKYATSQPELALELLRTNKPPDTKGEYENFQYAALLRESFAALTAKDPEKAHELIAREPELAKNGGLSGYLTYKLSKDMATAIPEIQQWLADPAMAEATTDAVMMAHRWSHGAGAKDPTELLEAIPALAKAVDADVLSGWAKVNPQSAAEFILSHVGDKISASSLRDEGVLTDLAMSSPDFTAKWLETVPDAAVQAEAATTLAETWARFDPDATAVWIQSISNPTLLDAATKGLAKLVP